MPGMFKGIAGLAILGASTLVYPAAMLSADAVCKEAAVNPISGHAECVLPPGAPVDPPPPRPAVVKLAVFDFEMEDAIPAAALTGQAAGSAAMMEKVTGEARRVLEESWRYILMDVSGVDAEPVRTRSLRNCNGCETAIASRIGAEQSLVGVVTKVTQTDYYVVLKISDARTGKIINQPEANFAGGPDGWASGVRTLISHQVLMRQDEP